MADGELIVYVTPDGPLGDGCSRYWEAVDAIGATTAQDYPPHVTLVGFFRRPEQRIPEVVDTLAATLATAAPPARDQVEVLGLRCWRGWVGLEVRSPWLVDVAERFAGGHAVEPGDDPIRPKAWLHLSLAYGVADLGQHARLAVELVDPTAAAGWTLDLWERRDPADGASAAHRWRRHASWRIAGSRAPSMLGGPT